MNKPTLIALAFAMLATGEFTRPKEANAANQAAYPISAIKHDPRTPERFLFMYQGKLTQLGYRTKKEVAKACGRLQAPSDMGCSQWSNDRHQCTIVYLIGKPHVYWHEIAHCNGMEHWMK